MKKLTINPSKEESKKITMLNVPNLVIALIEKVLRTEETNFRPVVTADHHTKTFITNVGYKLTPIQDYSGKELNSMQDALDFYSEVGNKIYGKYWMVELLKNEVRLSKNIAFGVRSEDPELVQYIKKRLEETDGIHVEVSNISNRNVENVEKPNKETFVTQEKKAKKETKNV